mmetsp:Transcript_11519/g.35600  ORF Transcript_11519/g.35600 Transcript_11519/m.35600 type:complete len:260 (-) Transcript_11519:437-1216(-)
MRRARASASSPSSGSCRLLTMPRVATSRRHSSGTPPSLSGGEASEMAASSTRWSGLSRDSRGDFSLTPTYATSPSSARPFRKPPLGSCQRSTRCPVAACVRPSAELRLSSVTSHSSPVASRHNARPCACTPTERHSRVTHGCVLWLPPPKPPPRRCTRASTARPPRLASPTDACAAHSLSKSTARLGPPLCSSASAWLSPASSVLMWSLRVKRCMATCASFTSSSSGSRPPPLAAPSSASSAYLSTSPRAVSATSTSLA